MKNDIRLIALDLDGTLLDSQKRLSRRNEAVLKECVQRGIYIVPCTGRIWCGVPDFIREFAGIHYAITVNGAVIEDVQEHVVLDEQKLSCEQAVEILKLARNFNTMYDAYAEGRGFGEMRFMEVMERYGVGPELQKMIRSTREVVPDVAEKIRLLGKPVEKINYFFGEQAERQQAKEALLARGDVLVSSSFPNNLEINALGASKGEAICRLAKHLGLKREQTMGFGDGENDITMMTMAGIGVAMENGMESMKEAADYITLTNDEDGVADAIEKLVFS